MRKVAVVVAHADDEVLGAGGVIARHAIDGDSILIVYMTPKITIRKDEDTNLDKARVKALKILGGNNEIEFKVFEFADQYLDTIAISRLVIALEDVLKPFAPEIIYTHSFADINEDHRRTYQVVMTAARPYAMPSVKEILCMEVGSATEWGLLPFIPTLYVDISKVVSRKLRAMNEYRQEMKKWPHPRSLMRLLAKGMVRGSESGYGCAEAFEQKRTRR